MNLNYAIFRSEPIMTLPDLAQIGSHNKREKKAYNSNPDINKELSNNNIELVPLTDKYVKGFYNLTKEYKKEHDERMKNERADRKKTFNQMLNSSRNCVADELLFTASNDFFKNMDKDDIKKWADTCMEFVYKDLGYKKEQVLHATVHMDEKTPHIHCVVIPLVNKLDKRSNTLRYTISKKQYIKDKIHLSELQDKYHERLVEMGYDLERGIKHSGVQNIKIREYKNLTRKLDIQLENRNDKLTKTMDEFENKIKTNKSIPFDKKHVILEKDTFDCMNKVINETKKVMEIKPKLENVFKKVNNFSTSYLTLEKQNNQYEKEIKSLQNKNTKLQQELDYLKYYMQMVLEKIKKYYRKMLQKGNEIVKEITTGEIINHFDNDRFNKKDVKDISVGTTKQDELFEYANIPDYYKETISDKDKNGYEISM